MAAEVASAEATPKHLTPVDNRGSGIISRPFLMPLFTGVRGRVILRSPYPAWCIALSPALR